MKKIMVSFLLVLMVSTVFASGNSEGGKTKIKIASMQAEGTPETRSIFKFKELVEERSGGKIVIEIYPNNQLGSPETYIDSTRQGNIEMCVPGTTLSVHQPMVAVPEMPFLFRDWAHVEKALTDPYVMKTMTEGIVEKVGLRNLGISPDAFRVVSSNSPIRSMKDFENMRLRVPNIPLYIEWAKGVGVNAIALPLSELFTALEQGVADGQENPFATIQMMKFYEVQKYITTTRHIFSVHGWYINEKFWQTLSKENQDLIAKAVTDSIKYNFEIAADAEKDAIKYLSDQGLEIIEPDATFKQQLVDSQKNVYNWFYQKYPGSKELEAYIRSIK